MATADLVPDDARHRIDRFVARFGPTYVPLAMHAAVPLVLTPDLLHYLRNAFLRGQVPWLAEADLLLSDLCKEVGYEQYAMLPAVRARLIAALKAQPNGPARIREIARLLLQYLRRVNQPREAQREQQWAALAYLDGTRVAREIEQTLAALVARLRHRPGDLDTLAALARITRDLAPQLDQSPELTELARDLADLLTGPARPADLVTSMAKTLQTRREKRTEKRLGLSPLRNDLRPVGTPEDDNARKALKLVDDLTYYQRLIDEAARQGAGSMVEESYHQIQNLQNQFDALLPRPELIALLMRERDILKTLLNAEPDVTFRYASLNEMVEGLDREIRRLEETASQVELIDLKYDVYIIIRLELPLTPASRSVQAQLYLNENHNPIKLIRKALEEAGLRYIESPGIFMDKGPLTVWVSEAIASSRLVLMVLTSSVRDSPSLLSELREAIQRKIPIVTIFLDPVDLSGELAFLNETVVFKLDPLLLEKSLPAVVAAIWRFLDPPVDPPPPPNIPRIKFLRIDVDTLRGAREATDEHHLEMTWRLQGMPFLDIIEFESRSGSWLDRFLQTLREHQPQVVNFFGSVEPDPHPLVGHLDDVRLSALSPGIAEVFSEFRKTVRLVFFEGGTDAYFAHEIAEVIDCVIVLDSRMSLSAAVVYAENFFLNFAQGRTFRDAIEAGEDAVARQEPTQSRRPLVFVREGVDLGTLVLTDPAIDRRRETAGPAPDPAMARYRGVLLAVVGYAQNFSVAQNVPVLDVQIAKSTRIPLDDVRNRLIELEQMGAVERAFMPAGLVATITEFGRRRLVEWLAGDDSDRLRDSLQTFTPVSVGYAYSYKDRSAIERVASVLRLLKDQGRITEWHERLIPIGDLWNRNVSPMFAGSRVILYFVSGAFLNSAYPWNEEMTEVLARQKRGETRVILIILDDCDWQNSPLGSLQILPLNGRPISKWPNANEAWVDVEMGILRVLDEISEASL